MKKIFHRFKKRFQKKEISDKKEASAQEDKYIPEELKLEKISRKEASPLNDLVWKNSLGVFLGSFLLGILSHIINSSHPIASWLLALIALPTWIFSVRMLLLDAKLKKFWMVWLILSVVLPFAFFDGGNLWIVSAGGSFVFLLFRKYRPYRHLTSRRRAVLFMLGLLALILMTTGGKGVSDSGPLELQEKEAQISTQAVPKSSGPGRSLHLYAAVSLGIFWVFTLFHLFFRARLHFMNLRPKLALSAFLITVITALLIIFMGLIILYGTLGATRGARVRSVLQSWTEFAAEDENFIPSFFSESFSYQGRGENISPQQNLPPWLPEFISSLSSEGSPFAQKKTIDQLDYFWIEPDLWIIHLKKENTLPYQIQGGMVDTGMMNRLAQIVQSNVRFTPSLTLNVMGESIGTVRPDVEKPPKIIKGQFLDEDKPSKNGPGEKTSLWHRPLGFGLTDVDIIELNEGELKQKKVLLVIETSLASIFNELTSEKNPFGQGVMISLLFIAIMLFIFEAFMFFFGVRITTGITSAVRALYRGTQRIARGDLNTKIDIPNEDELGDLAASFNSMARAVKKGREEAVLRAHLEAELETARKIQEKLLPHEMPHLHGFEIAGTSIPSKQVGGDYFDFLDMGKDRMGIAIADVSGKGIPAALLMANLQASLHSQALETEKIADVVSHINNLLVKSTDSHMFVTFFCGLLDRKRAAFTSVNAGHNPPVLCRADKKIHRLTKGGLVLGFQPAQKYEQQSTELKSGDVLVLFTDGITEARAPDIIDKDDMLFGENRLIQVIKDNASLSAGEIQAAVLQAVTSHTKNTPQEDDITLVVIKRREI
ncbi:MAG: PP2C family protein-serine/threonine phosphatase [Acidobacteriota bacterium]